MDGLEQADEVAGAGEVAGYRLHPAADERDRLCQLRFASAGDENPGAFTYERNGLVSRRVIASSPVAVEYAITPLGRTLQDPFVALVDWARQHGVTMELAQVAYDDRRVADESV